jgi:DNA invertase Pin-like site-specific DNA recombinase
MQKVTRSKYKTVKLLLAKRNSIDEVMLKTDLSRDTVYKIRRASSYKGVHGYFKTEPKNKYDNVMTDYIEIPPKRWWNKLRGKK